MERLIPQERRLNNSEKSAPMKRYEVIISDKAYEDMGTIYSYIAETLLSPETAAGQYDRIADAIIPHPVCRCQT